MKKYKCGFCDTEEKENNPLILGNDCAICSICVLSAFRILYGDIDKNDSSTELEIDFFESIREIKRKN